MIASFLQIAGLIGLFAAACIEFGVAGGVAGASISAVYVGLAMED